MTDGGTVGRESYNPEELIEDVIKLLRERGLHPDATGQRGEAGAGAGRLLRALGILPAGDYRMIDRRNASDDW
jgi:hypothetical protein